MDKIIVLGAGLVGKDVAIALSKNYDVSCADIQLCSLEMLSPQYPVTVFPCNFKDKKSLSELICPFDLVINASASTVGFETLKIIIGEKKNVVNLSLFPEKVAQLDGIAKKNNVTAIMNDTPDSGLSDWVLEVTEKILTGHLSRKGILHMKKEIITD